MEWRRRIFAPTQKNCKMDAYIGISLDNFSFFKFIFGSRMRRKREQLRKSVKYVCCAINCRKKEHTLRSSPVFTLWQLADEFLLCWLLLLSLLLKALCTDIIKQKYMYENKWLFWFELSSQHGFKSVTSASSSSIHMLAIHSSFSLYI